MVVATGISAISPAAARVSAREVKNFFADLESLQQAAQKRMHEQQNRISYQWIQPRNKEVECKVIYSVGEETQAHDPVLYWDGECKDGYASGLGREFFDSEQGLSSWLGEYGKPGEKPVYYYVHDYDSMTTSVGFNDAEVSNPVGVNGVHYRYSGDTSNSSFYVRQQYYEPETGRAYFLATDTSNDVVTRGISYSSGPGFLIQTFLSPDAAAATWAYFSDKEGAPLRYGIARMRNGQVVHIEYDEGSQQREKFPIELIEQFTRLEWEINAKLKTGQDNHRKGNQAVEAYKRRTCKGDLDIVFMDPLLYGQICLESADFTPYVEGIRKVTGEAKKRQEAYARQGQDSIKDPMSSFWDRFSLPGLESSGSNGHSQGNVSVCHVVGDIVSCNQN